MPLGGGGTRCACCNDRVYKLEELQVDKATLHKACFKCQHCKRQLSLSNFAAVNNQFYCKTHFVELFHSAGGKYSVFGGDSFKMKESSSFGGPAATNVKSNNEEAISKAVAKIDEEEEEEEGYDDDDETVTPPTIGLTNVKVNLHDTSGNNTSAKGEPDPTKYRSLKERLAAYESVAKSSSIDSEDEKQPTRSVATSVGSLIESHTKTKKPSSPSRNVATSIGSLDDEKQGDDFEEERQKFQLKISTLQTENEKLHKQVAKLKKDLALETAKALESDEWCAKLSKDLEALKQEN